MDKLRKSIIMNKIVIGYPKNPEAPTLINEFIQLRKEVAYAIWLCDLGLYETASIICEVKE